LTLSDKSYLTPAEIAAATVQAGITKTRLNPVNQLILGVMAGIFIALAAEGSNMAAFNLFADAATYGLGKALAGAIFGTGLMLVILAGGELFTGNTLILVGVLSRQIKLAKMLLNWLTVFIGNLIGSLFIAYLMVHSGLLNSGENGLGGMTIKIAAYKTGLPFLSAFYLGILCNLLVCLAVWMAYGAKDVTGKILAVFFPIWLFITSGFEHSIANMYYIPAGILAKANPAWVEASHLASAKLDQLNWQSFLVANLLPVTLGNIVGGALLVGGVYWFTYLRKPSPGKASEG
jgi:formate/nitrite transporter